MIFLKYPGVVCLNYLQNFRIRKLPDGLCLKLSFCTKNIFARRVTVSATEAAVAAEERSALATAAGAGGAGTICKLPSLSPFFSLRCRRRAEIDLAGLE